MATLYYETEKDSYLFHHGIKGQKWGVQNGPPYPLQDSSESAIINNNFDNIPTLILPKKEFGHVMHEFQTNMTRAQREQKMVTRPVGDYIYTAINESDGGLRFVKKRRIR